MTIAPSLLDELKNSTVQVPRLLVPAPVMFESEKLLTDEKSFRYALNSDAMATEKLAEGIRGFCADIEKLEVIVKAKIEESISRKK